MSSAWDCSGEAEEEPARRSRSSRRRLSFLPVGRVSVWEAGGLGGDGC